MSGRAWVVKVHDLEQLGRVGNAFAAGVGRGAVFDLRGPLGAGKTAFVRVLAAGLGVPTGVASPTFVICRQYAGRLPLYHLDAYRIRDPAELLLHGWDEMLERGVVAVEWGERARSVFPEERMRVDIEHLSPTVRRFRFAPVGAMARRLLEVVEGVLSGTG